MSAEFTLQQREEAKKLIRDKMNERRSRVYIMDLLNKKGVPEITAVGLFNECEQEFFVKKHKQKGVTFIIIAIFIIVLGVVVLAAGGGEIIVPGPIIAGIALLVIGINRLSSNRRYE